MSSSDDMLLLTPNYGKFSSNKNDSDDDDDDDNDSDDKNQKPTENNSSDFKKRLEASIANALKPTKVTPSTSSHESTSKFVATPQKFTYLPNIELDLKNKDQQNIFVRNYPPLPNFEEEEANEEEDVNNNEDTNNQANEEEFIQIPDLTKSVLEKAKVDFRAENFSNFYDGIIQTMKKRYGTNFQTQFVNIFADTKKIYKDDQKFVNRLINSDIKLDWYSTHLKSHPSITLFFPYHQIDIKFVSFRAHQNTSFGTHFIHKFRVYGIYDDQTVKCLSAFDSTAINDYEVKANYAVSSPEPIRGIHIVSDNGRFGLTAIELFGAVSFKKCQTQFTKKFLTSPETYEKVEVPKPKVDSKRGRKSFIKKLKTAFNNSGMIVPESDDDEVYESNEKEEEKPQVKKVIEKGPIQAFDVYGPDLCEILKRRFDFTVFSESDYEKFHKDRKYHCLSFDIATARITGIKIKTYGEVNGFIVYAAKAESGKPLEWEHLFSSKNESLSKSRFYVYPVNNPKEYSHFLIRTYDNNFTIGDVQFYGRAFKKKIDDFQFPYIKPIFKCPPTGVFNDTEKPGIFESMKKYYGAALYGFVTIKNKLSNGSIGRIYQTEYIGSRNRNFSCVLFYFHQNTIKLTSIKISALSRHCIKDLYIFGGSSVNTILHRYHAIFANTKYTYKIQNSEPIDFIAICNYGDTFVINDLELFGTLEYNDQVEYKRISDLQHDFDCIQKTLKLQVMKMVNYQKNEFRKELLSAVDKNSRVVFSVQHSKSYKDDILSYGFKTFKNFATFYNFGDNGFSILEGNPKNSWKTTTNQYENSFKVIFNHHSVRLTNFKLKTAQNLSNLDMPEYFYLFGYNNKLNRWDVILEHNSKPLKSDSYYSFDINEDCRNIPYRIVRFYSVTGVVSLSMIEFFGDLIEDDSEYSKEIAKSSVTKFNYTNKPSFYTFIEKEDEEFNHGLFRDAMKIYGPRLAGLVNVNCHCRDDNFIHEIWGASNSTYISKTSHSIWDHTISFFFPYHEVFVSGYHIRSGDHNGISNWSIIGCLSNDDPGTIIDTQNHKILKDEKSYYRYHTKDYENVAFRVIRFVGFEYGFYFDCLDFFGILRPVPPSKYLTEDDMEYQNQKLPSSIHEKWNI